MPSDAWNPAQYDRFKAERSRPFFDLLAMVEARPGLRAVDLGCGTGELTAELHARLGATATLGLDNSAAMLAKAGRHASKGLSFALQDIAAFAAAPAGVPPDLLFANASLQWVDDHPALLGRLAAALAPGGQLAVQMPMNHDYPTHTIARALAAEPPFLAALGAPPRDVALLTPEAYAERLDELGFARQRVVLEVYPHRLEHRDEVIEWVKGTLLTYYEGAMPAAAFADFLAEYRRRLFVALPDRRPFFYPFKRVLLWAAKA